MFDQSTAPGARDQNKTALTQRVCAVAGCSGPVEARGFCHKHYRRWQRHGDPLAGRISPCLAGQSRQTKRCYKCKKSFDRLMFSRSKSQGDGLSQYCKPCDNVKTRRDYQEHKQARAATRRRYREAHAGEFVAYFAAWHQANKTRRREQVRARQRANPAKYNAYQRQWAKQNPEKMKARRRKWRRANPEKVREQCRRRKAKLRGVATEKVDYQAIMERDKCRCYICGKRIKRKELQFDHVIPLTKGGAHCADNIACAHARCNNKKGTRIITLF